MSVVDLSADSWQASSPGLMNGLGTRLEKLGELQQGLVALAASDNISGQGADAMRAYINEVHVSVVQSLQVCLYTFQTSIGVYWKGYVGEVDSDGNFRLVNDEFDTHLSQLDSGMNLLRGFSSDLRSIASSASHLVSLGGAGANAADRTVDGFEQMRLIAKTQQDKWAAYEATDHGFAQVRELMAELRGMLQRVGTAGVGQGRGYVPGSFNLTLQKLNDLTTGMLDYCDQNAKVASDGWEALFDGYVEDVEAEEERKRKDDAMWGLLWDGLQIVAGAVITVIGVGLTPFTAGFSLGLTVLGGSLLVGGVNSAINHVSIASTGQELNLIGMASDAAMQWYDVNVSQPAMASGNKGAQFLAGTGAGFLQMASETAQMNVQEISQGIYTLATDENARSQMWNQIQTVVGKVAAGDTFTMGQIVGNLAPFGAAAKLGKPAQLLADLKTVGRAATSAGVTAVKSVRSALDLLKSGLASGRGRIEEFVSGVVRKPQGIDGILEKIRRGELTADEIKALPTEVREQLRGVDRGDRRDIFGKYTGSDTVSANKEALGLEKVRDRLGLHVISDRVGVRIETGGQLRYYDGLIHLEGNRYVGIEVKSGRAAPEYRREGNAQRLFDERVSLDQPASGVLNGESIEIVDVILQEVL